MRGAQELPSSHRLRGDWGHWSPRDCSLAAAALQQSNGAPVTKSLPPSFREGMGGGVRHRLLPQEAPSARLWGGTPAETMAGRGLRRLTRPKEAHAA